VQTYYENWPLIALLFGSVGMYLMGVTHGIRGIWDRTSTARIVRRTWRVLCGKPVQVLPQRIMKHRGRAVTIKDRQFVFYDK
jgi:hypothetical protein